ncbi:unnamed protein product [Linum trigynum]|uniref:Secreted protein n=1 Tax=Linum trigynum TaxID=586398 RepID=A0AAV2EVA9_9ROSI
MCISLTRLAFEFVLVVAEALETVIQRNGADSDDDDDDGNVLPHLRRRRHYNPYYSPPAASVPFVAFLP